ncbi:Late embryogenesis abundant protein, LEA-14 [Spatholobus suberectus]|nr:Late embryogenesis abundant protein, LEA-14 [Spatholobus suberectus]
MQDPSRTATGYPAPSVHHANGGQPPPPATAYPYTAPPPYPQPQYYNPNYGAPRSYASRSFFRAFFATMICLAVVFGVILIVTWLVLRPSLPHFTVHTFSLTNLSTTAQSISATWHVAFLVRNGNKKMTVTYNALRSSVFYRTNYIAESQLAPFKQDTKSETTLNATLSAAGAYLEPRVIDDLNSERTSGSVLFDVQVLASTSFRSGSWRFRTRVLKVLCRKVPVGVSSNATSGELVGGDRECQDMRFLLGPVQARIK